MMKRLTLGEQITLLRRIIDSLDEPLTQPEVASIHEDLDAGEVEVPVHQLCSQLIEYDTPITASIQADLRRLGQTVGLDSKYWTLLTVTSAEN